MEFAERADHMEYKQKEQEPVRMETSRPNLTGIPTQMKLDFEQRSGLPFDDVRVHYNSDKPAQIQAWAYTQGKQIYVAPGQERHLPHELGHIVQQKLGKVRPTGFIHGLPVNDQPDLESGADALSRAGGAMLSDGAAKEAGMCADVVQRSPQDYSKIREVDFIRYALKRLDPNHASEVDWDPFSSKIVTGGNAPEAESEKAESEKAESEEAESNERGILFFDLGRIEAKDLSKERFGEELEKQGITDQKAIERVFGSLKSLLPPAAEDEAAGSHAGQALPGSTIQVSKYKEAVGDKGGGLYDPVNGIVVYDSKSEKMEQLLNMEEDFKRFQEQCGDSLKDDGVNIPVPDRKTYALYTTLLHELGHRRQAVDFNGEKRDFKQITKSGFLQTLMEYENVLYHENLMPERLRKGYNGKKAPKKHSYYVSENQTKDTKDEEIELVLIKSICDRLKNIDPASALDVLESLNCELDLGRLLNINSAMELLKSVQEISQRAEPSLETTRKTVKLIPSFVNMINSLPQEEKRKEESKGIVRNVLEGNQAQILNNLKQIEPVLRNPGDHDAKKIGESLEALLELKQPDKEIHQILTGQVFRQTPQNPNTGGSQAEGSKPPASKPQLPVSPGSPPPPPPLPPPPPGEAEMYQKGFADCMRGLSADNIENALLSQAGFSKKITEALTFIRQFS